jgi:hypothetical protein
MKHTGLLILIVMVLLMTGCTTASMDKIRPIPIASGLSSAEALQAVAISPDVGKVVAKEPESYIHMEQTVQIGNSGRSLFTPAEVRWSVEDVGNNYAILGLAIKAHTASIKYEIVGRELVPTVLSSTNFRQSESRIHGNAIVWINRHAARIREAMWQVKKAKASKENNP